MKKELEALAHAAQEVMEKKLDPVGQADADIDNDGDVDGTDKYLHNRRKAIKKSILKSKKNKKGEDDPTKETGDTAVMNPKNENVASADKKPEMYTAPDGKRRTRMVPVDREIIKKESTDMTIREKLLSVLERREMHTKGATKPEGLYDKSMSSKGAMDMLNTPKEVSVDIKKATDDNAKAEKKAKVSKKNTTDQNVQGDMKIINPVNDITQKAGMKGSTPTVSAESYQSPGSFASMVKSIGDAYNSMYVDVEEAHMDPREKTKPQHIMANHDKLMKKSMKAEKLDDEDQDTVKDVANQLVKGVKAHGKQAKMLKKALDDETIKVKK